MAHRNPTTEETRTLLTDAKTIAMIGASSNPDKASHGIMGKLLRAGYHVIPVNPRETEVLGQKTYASVLDIPERVDIVDVFRRSEDTPPIADEADRVSRRGGDKSRLHLAIGPRTTGDLGSLPAPTLAAGGGVALEWSTLRFEASVLAWLPRRTSSDPSAVAGEIGLVTGEARGCAQLTGGTARLDACLGAEAGSTGF